MAFSSSEMISSMWNHIIVVNSSSEKLENCHSNSMDDCPSVCCYDNDYSNITASTIQNQNLKKKVDKIKYSYLDISLSSNLVSQLKYLWNTSPPNYYLYGNYRDKSYKNLVWIIKSTT